MTRDRYGEPLNDLDEQPAEEPTSSELAKAWLTEMRQKLGASQKSGS